MSDSRDPDRIGGLHKEVKPKKPTRPNDGPDSTKAPERPRKAQDDPDRA